MNEQLFWQHLGVLGGLQHAWWYNALVTPSLLVAVFGLGMILVAVRQVERKLTVFLLLLLACVPLLLILPSFYAALRPQAALGLVGMDWPAAANRIPRQAAETLSLYLNFLAQLGITGAVIGLLIALGGLTSAASGTNVPVISTAARQITQVVRDRTQRLRRSQPAAVTRTQLSAANCPYGRLEVLNGTHAGNQVAVRPGNTLGRKECDIIVTDAGVSKIHARFDVDEQRQTQIADQQSANGLFVYRVDDLGDQQKHDVGALNGLPFGLRSGDIIALGDPDHEEDGQNVIKLRFDHDYF